MRLSPFGLLAIAAGLAGTVQAQEISFRWPVACEIGRTCFVQHYVDRDPSPAARDYRCGTLTYDGHDGTDIRIPTLAAQKAGVDVVAAADGTVLRIRDGVDDVSVAERGRQNVENTECGNGAVVDHGNGWEAQYCHMAKGSLAMKPGDVVKAGDRIGRIGLSGMTEFPHLHFTLRKDGKTVDPFAPGASEQSCGGSGASLWEASLQRPLAYQAGSVLNKGFASGPVTMEAIESGAAEQAIPTTRSPALVAYVRAIGLKGGDIQTLTLFDPDGKPVAQNKAPPLDRDKAQWMAFAGIRQPEGGFRSGLYRAIYRVEREGKPAIEQAFGISLRP
ncbi:murein DD-endopeptidase MepM/ murein hydrolase activator NlpD [Microvirga flocculans]|uniref:Murein DD-endopeptidase MepM/ murein hydrolase activator NlpD n=1 Tax=Microvirga flocculans TaxID=217168 RepID=A0A7W6IHR3_9HYPH|nr:M23 family metallopeptidase [Microvirga flocculans]MBB4041366.1 murein DD-endopeptidase MepM/ murein hydrolase activator NlpD [Microvirga flocculans]